MKLRLSFAALSLALVSPARPAADANNSRRLDTTVITEVTDSGRRHAAAVSAATPAYYVLLPIAYRERGAAQQGKKLATEDFAWPLQQALKELGFRPATREHPPTVALSCILGSHYMIDMDNDAGSAEQGFRNILDRAALAGGEKFARELAAAIKQSEDADNAASRSAGPSGSVGAAAGLAQMSAVANPVKLFKQRSPQNEFLVDQATSNCYYVVVSAYAYASLATPQKELLWRTRMTARVDVVSQLDSLATLVALGGAYFGREMNESHTARTPVVRFAELANPPITPEH